MKKKIKFSVILSTINKYIKIQKIFNSFSKQKFKNFEIILIDQSNENKKRFIDKKLDLKYVKSTTKNLSINRNIGIKISSGEYLLFLDDDCYFESNFFSILNILTTANNKYLVCFPIKNSKKDNIIVKIKPGSGKILNIFELIRSICSSNFLIKKNQNYFDSNLGLGCDLLSKSGEDTDYLIKNYKINKKFYYTNNIFVYHPDSNLDKNYLKSFYYGVGFTCCLLKNNLYYIPIIFFIKNLINIIFNLKILNKSLAKSAGILYGFIYYFGKFKKNETN